MNKSKVPVYDAMFMQVLHCRQNLPGVAPHLLLLQPPLVTDSVHQVSSCTQLHGHVVAVLGLQSLQENKTNKKKNNTLTQIFI